MEIDDTTRTRQLPPSLSLSTNGNTRDIASPLSPTLPRNRKPPRSPFVATRSNLDYKNRTIKALQDALDRNTQLISEAEKINDIARLSRLSMIRTDLTSELDRRKTKEIDQVSNMVQTLALDSNNTSPPQPSNHVIPAPPRDAKIAYMPLTESLHLLRQHDIELKIARAEARIMTPTQSGQVTPTPEGTLTPLGRPVSTSEQQARMMAFLFPEADSDEDEDTESMDYEMSSEEDHA